jgi:hypothetical protein
MKKILILSFILASTSSFARGPHFFYCRNNSVDVSSHYIECLQTNFARLEQAFNGRLSLQYCDDPGTKLHVQFTNCIRQNFRAAQKQLINWGVPIYITNCYAGKTGKVLQSYQSCINNNFNAFSLVP